MNNRSSQRMPSQKIGGYEILERVGQGAMGIVYKARQVSMDRVVALKILARNRTENPKYVEQFVREARMAGKISSPHIIQVHDVGEEDGVYYFSMEFVANLTLKDRIKDTGKLKTEEAMSIAVEMATALESAHKAGLVHRDVKPENIMIDSSGRAKLADLGLGIMGDHVHGEIVGTPHYMSPEQCLGEEVDVRSDIYSLGATLYRALAGVTPYGKGTAREIIQRRLQKEPNPIRQVAPEVPGAFAFIIGKMMATNLVDRYQTPSELIDDLKRHQESKLPVGYHPRDSVRIGASPPESTPDNLPLLKILLPVGAIFLLLVIIGVWMGLGGDETPSPVSLPAIPPVTQPVKLPQGPVLPKPDKPDNGNAVISKPPVSVVEVKPLNDPFAMERTVYKSVTQQVKAAYDRKEYLAGWDILAKFGDNISRDNRELRRDLEQAKKDYKLVMEDVYRKAADKADVLLKDQRFDEAAAGYKYLAGRIEIPQLVERANTRAAKILEEKKTYQDVKCKEEWASVRARIDEACLAASDGVYTQVLRDCNQLQASLVFAQNQKKFTPFVRDLELQAQLMSELASQVGNITPHIKLSDLGKHALDGVIMGMRENSLEISAEQFATELPWRSLPHDQRFRLIERVFPRPSSEIILGKVGMAILLEDFAKARKYLDSKSLAEARFQEEVAWYRKIVERRANEVEETQAQVLFEQLLETLRNEDYPAAARMEKKLKTDYGHTDFFKQRLERLDRIHQRLVQIIAQQEADKEKASEEVAKMGLEKLGWRIVSGQWLLDEHRIIHVTQAPAMIAMGNQDSRDMTVQLEVLLGDPDDRLRILVRHAIGAEQLIHAVNPDNPSILGYGIMSFWREVQILDMEADLSQRIMQGLIPQGDDPSFWSSKPVYRKAQAQGRWQRYKISIKDNRLSVYLNKRKIYDKTLMGRIERGFLTVSFIGDKCKIRSLSAKVLE